MKKITLFIKRLLRVLFYVGLAGILVAAVLWKKEEITKSQKKEIVSRTSLWEKNGYPIDVVKIKRAPLRVYTKLSAKLVTNKVLKSDVTRDIQQKLRPGMPFVAQIKGKQYKGVLERVSPVAALESGLFRVDMKLIGSYPVDNSITIAAVSVQSLVYKNSLAVPTEAVVEDKGRNNKFVWVAKYGRATKSYITLADSNGELVRAEKGIKNGDLVIFRGISRLKEFIRIKIHKCLNCE